MTVRMPAGRRRNRIVIQSSTTADDSFGEAVHTWNTLATVWSEVEPMGGGEALASGAERTEAPVVFQFLYRSDVSANNRISWGGDIYDIESVENVLGRNKALRVTAVARG